MSRRFDISSDHVYWLVVFALASSTMFFVANVQKRRGALRSSHAVQIDSGARVTLVRVIDADEVSVRGTEGGAFVVRLLGIKGFSTTVHEPGISGLGQSAVTEVEKYAADKDLRVVFDELTYDPAGRVLAYLEADEHDVGERLLRAGRVVVYSRYPFSREAAYASAEAEARSDKTGLWGNYKAVSRVQGWQDTWKSARAAER